MERTKGIIAEEDKFRYTLDGLVKYKEQGIELDKRYKSLLKREISLPSREIYEVDEIVSVKREKDNLQRELESTIGEIDRLKKLRQQAKKMIAEYLPIGMKMRWERNEEEVYIVEVVSYDRDVPDIKIEREDDQVF